MRQKTGLSIGELQQSLGYEFKDYELLIQALTRRSAVNSRMQSTADNERLEFLGDKVLGLVVSDILMQKYPSYNEGELTKEVSALVRNKNGPLTGIAKKIRLGDFIIMDRGEEVTNRGRVHNKVLADTMEAVIGAIFIDSGKNYEAIKRFIGDHWCGLSQSDVLFKLAEDLHTQGDTESLYPKIIEAIKDGVDVRVKNHEGKTIFHLIDDPGIIRWIFNTQKNLVGIDLRGTAENAFKGDYEISDDAYYKPINLEGINFSNANLQGINLSSRTIRNVDFHQANLVQVNFAHVKFFNTRFTHANLLDANFDVCTMDLLTRESYNLAVLEGRANKFKVTISPTELWEAVKSDNIQLVKLLVAEGINVNIVDEEIGITPLHIAAGEGHFEITELLLNNGANVNAQPCQYFARDPREIFSSSYLRMMAQSRARVGSSPVLFHHRMCGSITATPLHLAAGNGHRSIVELLLQYGACIERKEWQGITPYSLALKNHHSNILDLVSGESILQSSQRATADHLSEDDAESTRSETQELLLPERRSLFQGCIISRINVEYTNQLLNDPNIHELLKLAFLYGKTEGIDRLISIGSNLKNYENLQALRKKVGDQKAVEFLMKAYQIGNNSLFDLVLELGSSFDLSAKQPVEVVLYRLLGMEVIVQELAVIYPEQRLTACIDQESDEILSSEITQQDRVVLQLDTQHTIKQGFFSLLKTLYGATMAQVDSISEKAQKLIQLIVDNLSPEQTDEEVGLLTFLYDLLGTLESGQDFSVPLPPRKNPDDGPGDFGWSSGGGLPDDSSDNGNFMMIGQAANTTGVDLDNRL